MFKYSRSFRLDVVQVYKVSIWLMGSLLMTLEIWFQRFQGHIIGFSGAENGIEMLVWVLNATDRGIRLFKAKEMGVWVFKAIEIGVWSLGWMFQP